MNLRTLLLVTLGFTAIMTSCKDDNIEPMSVPLRDRAEVDTEDQLEMQTYLETHFYNYEEFENPPSDFDYVVRFDTIAGANIDRTPLIDRPELSSKVVTRSEIDYTMYILNIREGAGKTPTVADSTFVTYRGELLDNTLFDSSVQPVWFDLPGGPGVSGVIDGFSEAISEFKESSGFVENPDNTITFNNDYGIGAVIMPSGVAYFGAPPSGIPLYSPLIFSFQLLIANQADHDNDGIPSIFEDLDNDNVVLDGDDDTDENGFPNYVDNEDDGDGILTQFEITSEDTNDDGVITMDELIFVDTDSDGILNHLDDDDDNDGIPTREEISFEDLDENGTITTDEVVFNDTNNDGVADYLQANVDGRL